MATVTRRVSLLPWHLDERAGEDVRRPPELGVEMDPALCDDARRHARANREGCRPTVIQQNSSGFLVNRQGLKFTVELKT